MLSRKFTDTILDKAKELKMDERETRAFVLGAHSAFQYFSFDLAKLNSIAKVMNAQLEVDKPKLD